MIGKPVLQFPRMRSDEVDDADVVFEVFETQCPAWASDD